MVCLGIFGDACTRGIGECAVAESVLSARTGPTTISRPSAERPLNPPSTAGCLHRVARENSATGPTPRSRALACVARRLPAERTPVRLVEQRPFRSRFETVDGSARDARSRQHHEFESPGVLCEQLPDPIETAAHLAEFRLLLVHRFGELLNA